MLPPISIKNILCVRAVSSIVMDRIVYETIEPTTITTIVNNTSPTDILYVISTAYFIRMYIQNQSPKHIKQTRLNQQVLSDDVYRCINISLFILFLLIKYPLNAI
jgi:hypothetical protein